AQMILDVGASNVVATAERMGITSHLRAVPSAVLGTNEVNSLEMASAYGTLATVGEHVPPVAVRSIVDPEGREIYHAGAQAQAAVAPAVAYEADQILEKVVQQGTGVAANIGR